jgi:hypothetical protein
MGVSTLSVPDFLLWGLLYIMSNNNLKNQLLKKYNNHCAYCGCEISRLSMQVDHIHAKSSYIETDESGKPLLPNRIENLNPSCKACNNYKHFYSVDEFRMYLKQMFNTKQEYLFKSKTKLQLAKNYGCIITSEWDGLFYYERVKQ